MDVLNFYNAISSGEDVAKYLIAQGADLDLVCKRRGKPPREFLPPDFLQQKE